jgi:hypothetical protein
MKDDNNSTLRRFLLPEKDVSLKLVFDNARNYVIVGAFVAMARWFENGKATVPPLLYAPEKANWAVSAWVCLAVAGILFLMNVGQSYHIGTRLFDMIAGSSDEGRVVRRKQSLRRRIFIRMLALCALTVVLAVAVLLIDLAVYIVWYSAVGSGH